MAGVQKRGKSASSRNIVKPKSRTESERTLTTRPVSRSKEILKTPDNPNERLAPFQDPLNPPTESSQPPSSSSTVISQAKSSQELNLASQLIPWLFMRHSIQETSIWAAHDAEALFTDFAKALAAQEEEISQDYQRYQFERELQVLDSLITEKLSGTMPILCRRVIHMQKRFQKAISQSMRIMSGPLDPESLASLRLISETIDQLHQDYSEVLHELTECSRLLPVSAILTTAITGLMSVLDTQIENLSLEKRLLTKLRENERFRQHLESLT